jgi:MFS family permease
MIRIPEPMRVADFRFYWIARFCAVLATMGMVVIIGYQVYDVARSDYGMSIRQASLVLGLLGAAQFVPLALLTPVAGLVADRFERRTVARLANLIDMSVALGLGWLTHTDQLTLPILFIFAALHGIARVFVNPAMAAIAPNIVPARILPEAIAMSSIAWQVASVGGPAIGGFLYAADPAMPYWVSAGLMAVAIAALTPVRPVRPPVDDGQREANPFRRMIDGLTYVRNHRFLLGAITLDLFAVLLGGATAMLPVFARDILQVGTEGLGLLRAAPAVGAAGLAIYYAWYPLKQNVGIKMLAAVAGFGLMTILFGISNSMILSLAALVALGAFDMLSVYVRSSLVQLHTPDSKRGRVSAVSGLAISASNELGELQSGLVAALLGPIGAVVFGGAAAIGVAGLWSYLFPELRRARTFDPPDHLIGPEDVARELA